MVTPFATNFMALTCLLVGGLLCISPLLPNAAGFVPRRLKSARSSTTTLLLPPLRQELPSNNDHDVIPLKSSVTSLQQEAIDLKQKAERLRQEIQAEEAERSCSTVVSASSTIAEPKSDESSRTITKGNSFIRSPWAIVSGDNYDDDDKEEEVAAGVEYRLYIDVGREDGTWMDPRWGASGKRIPFTLDVRLLDTTTANNHPPLGPDKRLVQAMVRDNSMGKSSPVYSIQTGAHARLRDGFDRMLCYGGAYRIDLANGRYTIRMVLEVDGTKADQNYMYGDVSIPPGFLYLSLPCFGGNISQLSTKEGPVTVRQSGWHTGWRRKESRILGVFTAKPLAEAKRIDSY